MTADTNEALSNLLYELKVFSESSADMLTEQAAKLAEVESRVNELEDALEHKRSLTVFNWV